ncbi:hypothetical protein [Burkholderia sp. Bp9031]|uniref:hypothetical protein n=1 Tax=Burkholderia sp. Bp9031 TaxID=2184566 RepID=UPI000F5DAB43|nr:hypothetical protein [Burkholderia sp. Bp9031]
MGNRARTLHERDLKRTASRFSLNRGWRIISHYYGMHIPAIPVVASSIPEISAHSISIQMRGTPQRSAPVRHPASNRQKIPDPASDRPLLMQNIPHFMRSRIKHVFGERHSHDWPEAITRY